MVKKLDEKFSAGGPDHVGIRLWFAYEAWKAEFVRAMNRAGHGWFTPSRANLLGFTARSGTAQAVLVERMAVSKQAVQQLIDGLEREGVLERVANPADRRGRLVRYTSKGLAALADADRIKADIEAGLARRMGAANLVALRNLLARFCDGG